MKKQVTLIALSLLISGAFSGFAQKAVQPCNTYEAMEELFKQDPQAKARYESAQKQLSDEYGQSKMQQGKSAAFVYTVPVVFHILHVGGPENISDALCISALNQVNSDFARLGSDANTVAQPFQNLYIDSEIRFVLARKDPNGNCTNGIVHRYDSRTTWTQANTSNFNGITWNPTRYLNIIIVKEIVPTSTVVGGGQIVGYTYKPGSWGTGASQDAIVYDAGFLNGLSARSLSHEIGHWLNLSHTFGNTNNPGVTCGDDGLFDTPPTKGSYNSCQSSASGNACATSATSVYAAGQQNTENIMDYSTCPKNFTTDQTNAMRTAVASMVSNRQNLWQTSNLIATDVNATGICAPISEFFATNSTANSYTVCAGGSITFRDNSYNGTVATYAWAAGNGGMVASPSSSMTSITFPTIGTTTVALTVGNTTGSNTKSKTVVVVDATPGINSPTMESFEAQGVPAGWSVVNPNLNTAAWDQTFDVVCHDGWACFFIEGIKCGGGQVDYLETPVIDVASNTDKTFLFSIAYAQKLTTHNDVLRLQGSRDCGGTWTDIVSLSAAQMQLNSGGVTTNSFAPGSVFEWKTYTVNSYPQWNQFTTSSTVKLRFAFTEGTAGQGNNLYLDAINLFGFTSGTGVNELSKSVRYVLSPNPANGETNVEFNLNDAANVKVSVVDVLGREVTTAYEGNMAAGQQKVILNKGGQLPKGIYLVNLSINDAKISKKLLIE